jgi:23S rRNA pseudouridine1911/1915/1917 synthase
MRTWRHRATTAEAGERLDRLVERHLETLTRSQVKRLVQKGHVHVDGERVKAGHPLREGETVTVTIPPPPDVVPRPEAIPVTVVFEDELVAVVDKPAGMTVHPGAGRPSGTLVNALLGRGMSLSAVGAPFRPGIVHRLDKGTSGLLVVAKTDSAHRVLSRGLAAREFHRVYLALVWGELRPPRGSIDAPLARSGADRRRMRVVGRGGKNAVTRYRVTGTGPEVSAVALRLETGRTHQIRAHLKHRGHPVFGDPEYGGRSRRAAGLRAPARSRVAGALGALSRQALHAAVLGFAHPGTGELVAFTSAVAPDMMKAAALLEVPPDWIALGSREDL